MLKESLRIIARIDALFPDDPYSRSRRMLDNLTRDRIPNSRDRVRNLVQLLGITGYLSAATHDGSGRSIDRSPLLVHLRPVTAVDQAWATNITYIQLQKGFPYLVAIVDLFPKNALSWKLSNTLDTEFCLDALEMTLGGGRRPEILHSDHGCQFTSADFVGRLQGDGIKISSSGRKRCFDNILLENAQIRVGVPARFSDGWDAEISLTCFLWRYNPLRPYSS